MSWGYDKENGPNTWADNFPAAKGLRQSPVDIDPGKATYDPSLSNNPLTIVYNEEANLNLENPGLSFKANCCADSVISGGPVEKNSKYKLVQFHFHWGHDDKSGSEHTIKGEMYPSELHLVHYNTKYGSFGDALSHSDGLAVIGVFLKVGDTPHSGFQKLSENAQKVKCKESKANTGVPFNPKALLPENTNSYWTYDGSLTTPPCNESVTWIVMKEDISISKGQIESLRHLCCDEKGTCPIPANYRPPLDLGSRMLRASFE